ncbi:T9SS type A sorting domain-containing protein [Bacteroides sedimenti]|uniref:Secretion system C-terminal sorting domain-containing protein n=1 Tax=Bacteroides sedimenti TaxID=2136147 RepID=A0ABM8ICC8_9BACE
MKKIFTTITCIAFAAMTVNAQRINNLTIDGVTPLSKYASFTPGANPGEIQMVFLPNQDLTNLKVTPTMSAYYSLKTPATMPTDFSSMQSVTISNDTLSATYNIVFKSIKPISLPVAQFDFATAWTSATEGWAGSCAEPDASGNVKLGSGSRSLILAFKDAPGAFSYQINVASTTWDPLNVFDVQESADGITWNTVAQYNGSTPMPLSTATPAEKTQNKTLDAASRYVRFIYSNRKASNVTVAKVSVAKNLGTGIASETAASESAYYVPATKSLMINGIENVAKVRICDISGKLLLDEKASDNVISLNSLAKGTYIVVLVTKDGKTLPSKINI